jgi:hypothetical protein
VGTMLRSAPVLDGTKSLSAERPITEADNPYLIFLVHNNMYVPLRT